MGKNLKNKKNRRCKNKVKPVMLAEKKEGNRILLTTMTKEFFMLARIHYDLFNKEKIQQIFSKLKCMEYDNIQERWVWLYEAEAKKLKFKGSYYEIPKEKRPIVLGSFYLKDDNEFFLNLNSFERTKKAIIFFNKYIPRTVAKVTDATVLNKIFDFYEGNLPKHEDYFDKGSIEIKDPDRIINETIKVTSSIKNRTEKLGAALTLLQNNSKQALPEVEKFPIHFYEDGIIGLDASLTMRETIAFQHWNGNKDYSFYDLMQKIISQTS